MKTNITKREYFAGLAMQVLLAHRYEIGANNITEYEITFAVKIADKLIEELERTKKNKTEGKEYV